MLARKRPTGGDLSPGELAGDFLEGSHFLLLDGLMKDGSLFASAMAALKCRRIGGRTGIPTLEEVGAFLKEREKGRKD